MTGSVVFRASALPSALGFHTFLASHYVCASFFFIYLFYNNSIAIGIAVQISFLIGLFVFFCRYLGVVFLNHMLALF